MTANFGLGGRYHPTPHDLSAVVFAPSGRLIAIESRGNIYVWDTHQERVVRQFLGADPAFTPDGKLLAVRTISGVRLLDLTTGRIARDLDDAQTTCFAISPDSRTLATGRTDTTILLWDLAGLVEQRKR